LSAATLGSTLKPAKVVNYLDRKSWVLKLSANLIDQKVDDSVSYACGLTDYTRLGYKTFCGGLDAKGNISND
jgi:hypothetical protein